MHVLLIHDPERHPLAVANASASGALPLSAILGDAPRALGLQEALSSAGAEVITTARSTEEALALLRRAEPAPELAVVDLATAGDVTECRKLARKLDDAPLLVIASEDELSAAYDEGADDCLALPLRRGELVARVRAAAQLHAERTRRSRRERRLTDELRLLQQEKLDLERIVCTDSLTGLANRRHAHALLAAEWKRSAREGTPLSLIMIDLDCFHAYNESYGHPGGDRCLREVTDRMVMCLRRPSDFLGRYGGEEFMAVLAGTDALGAQLVAERMRAAVESLEIPHESSTCARVVTISVGFATARPTRDTPIEDIVKAADRALIAAKHAGRNRACGDAPPPPARERVSSEAWRRFPVVIADPWYADRIPAFLAVARCELQTFRQALEAGAFDRVKSLACSLRASATDHGIATIAELATMLETAARASDRASLGRVVDELAEYISHVQVTYRRAADTEAC